MTRDFGFHSIPLAWLVTDNRTSAQVAKDRLKAVVAQDREAVPAWRWRLRRPASIDALIEYSLIPPAGHPQRDWYLAQRQARTGKGRACWERRK